MQGSKDQKSIVSFCTVLKKIFQRSTGKMLWSWQLRADVYYLLSRMKKILDVCTQAISGQCFKEDRKANVQCVQRKQSFLKTGGVPFL